MKSLKNAALLAFAGACFYGQAAQAAETYTGGDIFLGFRNTGASSDYLVDIGQAVYSTPAGTTITIGNLSTDLVNTFGASWFTSGHTKWGSISDDLGTQPASTLYAGHVESSFGTFPVNPGSTYNPQSSGNQGTTQANVDSLENTWAAFDSNTGNVAGLQASVQLNSDSNSWASFMTSPYWGQFSGFEATITSSGTGANGHAIDLFQIIPNDAGGGSTPNYDGRFVIDSTGTVTYTAAGSVPEPSALTALAGGAGLLGLIRRRRAVTAA